MNDRAQVLLEVLNSHGARLHALLFRLTLCADTADDLIQELFLKLAYKRRFDHAKDPAAYAFRAAIHLAFDWRRRQRRAPPAERLSFDPEGRSIDPASQLAHAEQFEKLLLAMERLSAASRDCLVLRYIEQNSYEAVAERLGKTPHQVRAICSKAIARLRGLLEPLGQGALPEQTDQDSV